MKDIILFGIQGSGKGTQAKLLVDAFPDDFSYFSSGDLFRALTGSPNPIGDYVKNRMASGQLIDDKVTNAMFESYMYTVLDEDKAMLLDGYPRTISQVEDVFSLFEKHDREVVGIEFVLSDEIAIQRMKARGRNDDTDESIAKRLQQFYDKTQPMLDAFAKKMLLIKIDASASIEQIHEEVKKVVLS